MSRPRPLALFALALLTSCDPPSAAVEAGARDSSALDAALDGGPVDAASVPDAGPGFRVVSVTDLGALPHPSDTVAGRDGASSGVLEGQLLWTFGDTFLYQPTPVDGSHVATATSAWSTPEAPLLLTQPVDANGIPSQFIPYTDLELAENRADALNGWALWPGGVIDPGDGELLVLFQRIERTEGSGFDGVGVGTAHVGAHDLVARRDPDDLFSRPLGSPSGTPPLYGPGGVTTVGDTVYLFGCQAGCRVARAPRARAAERDAYEFYDGTAWVRDITAARVVLGNVAAATSVTYNAYLGRYLSVTSRGFSNEVLLRTAEHVEGPWPLGGVVLAADEVGLLSAGEGFDYLAQEQVALSSPDGREIVISYSRPLGSFRGEVRLARITLE